MRCQKCQAENPDRFQYCGACGAALFLAMLQEVSAAGELAVHYLFAGSTTLGRHFDNNLVLLDSSISRYHARIDYAEGQFSIQDLGSSNGVFVNEQQVERQVLQDLDRLKLGKLLLLFRTSHAREEERQDPQLTQERFLAAIQDIGQSARHAVLTHHLLEIAAEFAISLTRAERAVIFLYDRNLVLYPAVCHNVAPEELDGDEFSVSLSTVREAESSGAVLMRDELLQDPRFNASRSIHALQLNTIICLPLLSPHVVEVSTAQDAEAGGLYAKGALLGVLYLDSRRPLKGLPQHRQTMLQVLADQTALAIENAILQRKMAEQKNLRQQIRAAKAVQQRLFPSPRFSHPRFAMAYHYAAAEQIGGDYLAFLPLSGTRYLFAIGDVVGKGLPAGLVVMTLHGGLYSEITHRQDLSTLIRNLDRLIHEQSQSRVFVTFLVGVLDSDEMTLEYTSAGHTPLLLYRRAGNLWHELRAPGIPLGLDPGATRTVATLSLQPDDVLIFYTDGVTEARDAGKRQFSMEGLKQAVRTWFDGPGRESSAPEDLVQSVLAELRQFTGNKPLGDDTTLMALMVK